ncbi:ACT domain-containing protein ACR4 [Sesamum angolense]|uniref:ACT domain-containing protein ACR n=1 Tax=Sesamum angolense TaxID=2727404 RepID=A0AAE1X0T7_9LAMI|nr:ACT domain-containing protein ACR4 [Sesamum angolense]
MDCWSSSLRVDDEFKKLVIRMNPPRVTVDNASDKKATLIKVDSANKRGSLLEVVQVLTDLNLIIRRAYISSDGEWFMDVFYVTDEFGNKVYEDNVSERIQQSLGPRGHSFRLLARSVGVQSASEHTTIELSGRDRPGLLSEVFAVLTDLKCNVVAAEVWTHNSRMASVVYITDEASGSPINDPDRLANIKQLLLYVLKGDREWRSANSAVSVGSTHTQRRLHQMMYADRDYDVQNVDKCDNRTDQTACDRRKLCRERYVVFHGTIIAEGPEAQQGIRLELCSDDRVGLLSDVTRIFRENGLSVTRAEVTTRGTQAVNVFYVTDASGSPVKSETIEAVRKEIGLTILHVKDDTYSTSPPQETGRFSLGSLFRSRSEKFLYSLGLIKSCS